MKTVTHIEKRGKWVRPVGPRKCCACSRESDRAKPMPSGWSDHLVDGAFVFACSTLCRLARGLK